MTWFVLYYDINAREIKHYDVVKCQEANIKKMKKSCKTKEEFASKMRLEFMWRFWSKCQWELIVEIDKGNRVWLSPWVGCKNPKSARTEVTNCKDFDWMEFAKAHIDKQIYKTKAKIDVFDQLEWRWEEFVDYCWNTRLKYERDDPKFHK